MAITMDSNSLEALKLVADTIFWVALFWFLYKVL
jgi:hypothetical protein